MFDVKYEIFKVSKIERYTSRPLYSEAISFIQKRIARRYNQHTPQIFPTIFREETSIK